jgi:hypothetical protein
MNVTMQGFLIGAGIAVVLVFFEYTAIVREVAERSARVAKKVDWDSNQKSRMRNIITFGLALPFGFAVGAWWVFG